MRYLFTLTNLMLCGVLWSQSIELRQEPSSSNAHSFGAYCGSKSHKSLAQKIKEAAAFRTWRQTHHFNAANPIRTIPVVFHLLEYDLVIRNEEVEAAVSSLNNAFSHSQNDPNGADFSGGPLGVDTKIQFCLAQRAPDGGLTTGIVRWRTDYENMDVDLEDPKLKTQGQWDPRYYLNIWVLNHLDTESDQSYMGSTWWNRKANLGGYSAGPGGVVGPDARLDGVIVVGMGASLLAHEIGHYFDLAHTFSADCSNGDCLVNGDGICDTPPDKSQTGCGENTCNTDTLSNYSNGYFRTDVPDMTSNFMDYSSCPSEFTQGQADKMWFVIDNHRINLAVEAPSNNDACIQPCDADFRIDFAVSERYPEPNVPIDFTSSMLGNGLDRYEWYVERLGSPGFDYPIAWLKGYNPTSNSVGADPNLQYTFLEPGKYRVYLKAWDSSNPDCYASYSRTIRVTCLGIDARFTPSVRFIAAKQPKGKLTDSVVFRNRSINATDFEWTVKHIPYDNMAPAQPDFISNDTTLDYTFLEPGDYFITLIAKNGATCQDTCGPFKLPVDDPTIDGTIKINQVDCYYEDSLRVSFKLENSGYDTIRVGTPITFYDEDPGNANPTPKALGTYYIDKIVFGKDRGENYVVILPVTRAKLDQLWAVFNDLGTTSFPITWPMSDRNVMSVNSEFPPSGHNELEYDNNYSHTYDFQFRIDLGIEGELTCSDQRAQLEASYENTDHLNGIEWIPRRGLSCTDCLDPILTLPDEDHTQRLILTSEYFCKDTVDLFIPTIKEEVPPPNVSRVPASCVGESNLDVEIYVDGNNLTWYTTENGGRGTKQVPALETNTPGNYSLWVSQTINACEGPRTELSYTIREAIRAPAVSDIPNICVGDEVPDLSSVVSGANIWWYERRSGGMGEELPPQLQSDTPGTYRFWVSRKSGNCESPRAEVSVTVVDAAVPPSTPDPLDLCFGSTPPNLTTLVPGSDLRWYNRETGGNEIVGAPNMNTNRSGSYTYWVSQISQNCESLRAPVVYTVAEEVRPPASKRIPDLCVGSIPPILDTLVIGHQLSWYRDSIEHSGQTKPPIINTQVPGDFLIWVTQSANGCESRPTAINYSINPIPTFPELTELPDICVGDEVPDLNQFIVGETLLWYPSQAQGVGSLNAPPFSTDSTRTLQYWVSQQVLGCEGPRLPIEILVADINIVPGGTYEIPEGGSGEIRAEVSVFPEGSSYFVEWLDASDRVIATDELITTIQPLEPTFYTVLAEANGCIAQQSIWVDLIYQIDPTKIFSPNGDGKNDTWYIGDIDKYPNSNLTIYNRWGSVVYQAQGYQNDWQGTQQNGRDLPVATYYFVIDLQRENQKMVTGSVTIIR